MATLKETVNDMVFKLRVFSSEVTRVSLEVGTKGQLGGQAVVLGVEVCFFRPFRQTDAHTDVI